MTFVTKNNKCYELDSFDFGWMPRTGIYLLFRKNKQGYRSREISVVIRATDIFMRQYASPDKSNKGIARWHSLCYMDRYRCGRHCVDRYLFL